MARWIASFLIMTWYRHPYRLIVSFLLAMTDVSSKPLAGFKTTARVWGTVISTLNSQLYIVIEIV
ncbi:MAG: hypothetical protein LBD53_04250 [Tannerella sp.]|nr:hypothetical protein [Tannerella sp.]